MPENTPVETNTSEARLPTGELRNQAPVTSPTTPAPATTTTEPAAEGPKPSLLNQEEPKAAEAPAGAPEAYTDFKVPEGYTLDKETLGEAAPIFKELGLSQDQAQKLVDFYTKRIDSTVNARMDEYTRTREGWQAEVKAKYGQQLTEVKATVGRALASLDPKVAENFKQVMDMTGAGDNPAFIEAFYQLSKRATEGRPVTPGNPSAAGQQAPGSRARPSPAQSMFPNLPSAAAS